MKISKKDSLEWFEYLTSLTDSRAKVYSKYEEIISSVLSQIETAVIDRHDNMISRIKNLKSLENRSFFIGNEEKFPKGCQSCLLGKGMAVVRKTSKCNLECKFCYYYGNLEKQKPLVNDIWEIGGTKFHEKDIETLISIYDKPSGVGYVYLEPFIEIEKYYSVVKKFSKAGIYQHLYTNGTLATEKSLEALGQAGLDEIRFNLGATECADNVIENIKIAKKYIKYVGIETPMTQEFFKSFFDKKETILDTKLDFINCAELHLNEANINNYRGESMYISRGGYVSPIWSRELTFKFMMIADEENWDLVVHDCSNDTKFFRGLNADNKLKMFFGSCQYGCEFSEIPFEAFFPILKDESFKFLEEEELPSELKVRNICESFIL